MTPRTPDDLGLLAAANPVDIREPLDEAERAVANALLERIVTEPLHESGRLDRPRRPRGARRFTLAGALVLAAIVAVLAFPAGKGTDAVAQAVAALSGSDGVFHVVTQTTIAERKGTRTRTWTETWATADGRRSRSLIYDVAPDGSRGRLVAERVGSTTVIWASPRDGASISGGDGSAEQPRSHVLALLRQGRVTKRTVVTIAGRSAWRFELETRVDNTVVETRGRMTKVPAFTRRTVLVVDQRTDLPLLLRTSGVAPTQAGSRGGRVTFPRRTATARFSAFERLTDSAGAAGLEPSRRFKHRRR